MLAGFERGAHGIVVCRIRRRDTDRIDVVPLDDLMEVCVTSLDTVPGPDLSEPLRTARADRSNPRARMRLIDPDVLLPHDPETDDADANAIGH